MSEAMNAADLEAQNGTIAVTPDTDAEALAAAIEAELNDGWTMNADLAKSIRHNAVANGDSVTIVEGWFSEKELKDINVFVADEQAETDSAVLFDRLHDLTTMDDTAHFQRNMTDAWVPKSVIQVQVVAQ